MQYGAFGDDLDISEYLKRLPDGGKCLTPRSGTLHVGQQSEYDDYVRVLDVPRIVGLGPVECSTCTDVALLPEVVWDTNRYYRELGFVSPYMPTKKELRLAFQEKDGPNNPWLMMAFQVLINARTRLNYDTTPLGERYLDTFTQEALKKEAVKEAVRRRQESGQDTEAKEVLQEWGIGVAPKDQDSYGEDSSTPEDTTPSDPSARQNRWRWSYYRWRSFEDDTQRLGHWQQLLVSAFAARKMQRRFSVGFFGKQPHRCLSAQVDGRHVFFLHEDEMPDRELAEHIVMQVLLDEARTRIGARRDYPELPARW